MKSKHKQTVRKEATATKPVEESEDEEEVDEDDEEVVEEVEEVEEATETETDEEEIIEETVTVTDTKPAIKSSTTTTTTKTVVQPKPKPPQQTAAESVAAKHPTLTKVEVQAGSQKPDDKAQQQEPTADESLLLPLLQGLLQKNSSQRPLSSNGGGVNGAASGTTVRDSNAAMMPHVEDSGTESGEDLRLLAAGLRSAMHSNQSDAQVKAEQDGKPVVAKESNLLDEVTRALERLEYSLKEGGDMNMKKGKKKNLLLLVSRLRSGLCSPDKLDESPPEAGEDDAIDEQQRSGRTGARGCGGQARFARRKNRNSRHTVGVSREELADARHLMEEMMLRNSFSTSTENSQLNSPQHENYVLQKQSSVGTVLYRPNQFVAPAATNSPPVHYRNKKPKFKFMRQSLSLDQSAPPQTNEMTAMKPKPVLQQVSFSGCEQSHLVKVNGHGGRTKMESLSSEDEMATVMPVENGDAHYGHATVAAWKQPQNPIIQHHIRAGKDRKKIATRTRTPPGKVAPLNDTLQFMAPPQQVRQVYTVSTGSDEDAARKRASTKFNKKLRMKRANTIDIPKQLMELHQATASSAEEESDNVGRAEEYGHERHQTAVGGLKKVIEVSDKVKAAHVVPQFKPQTENDHKFLAFIQKQAPSNAPAWVNPHSSGHSSDSGRGGPHNWNNKFDNIKNTFEGSSPRSMANVVGAKYGSTGKTSARNFWQTSETQSTSKGRPTYVPQPPASSQYRSPKTENTLWKQRTMSQPEIMHRPMLTAMEDPPLNDHHRPTMYRQDVVESPPAQPSQPIAMAKQVPIPKPVVLVNQFSHNPMSAFKPLPRKIQPIPAFKPIKQPQPQPPPPPEKPLIQHVKRCRDNLAELDAKAHQVAQLPSPTWNCNKFTASPTNKSPTLPWTAKPVFENRNVLNLAATKFSGRTTPPQFKPKPRLTTNNGAPIMAQSWTGGLPRSFQQPSQMGTRSMRIYDKRPSLPNTAYPFYGGADSETLQNTQLNENLFTNNPSYVPPLYSKNSVATAAIKSDPPSPRPLSRGGGSHSHSLHDLREARISVGAYSQASQQNRQSNPHQQQPPNNYTVTDYTPVHSVSTCVPTWHVTNAAPDSGLGVPATNNTDSITNPNGQPLILTCTQPVYSPSKQQQQQLTNGAGHSSLKIFDYPSPVLSSNNDTNEDDEDCWDDDDDDDEPELTDSTEYKAVSSRVMTGPVCQKAVTVTNKVKKRYNDVDDDTRSEETSKARSLQSVLKNIKKGTPKKMAVRPRDIPSEFQKSPEYGPAMPVISNAVSKQTMKSYAPVQMPHHHMAIAEPPLPQRNINDNMFNQYSVTSASHSQIPAQSSLLPQQDMVVVHRHPNQQAMPPQVTASYRKSWNDLPPASSQYACVEPPARCPLPPKLPAANLTQYRVSSGMPKAAGPQIVETPATPRAEIPSHVIYNNVREGYSHQLQQQQQQQRAHFEPTSEAILSRLPCNVVSNVGAFFHGGNTLSKSDSWHKICQMSHGKPPSPGPGRAVQKTKSQHNLLSLPKQFEGGIDRDKVVEKQKTVAAYFGTAQQSATTTTTTSQTGSEMRKRTSINRVKTSSKASTSNQNPSTGLSRSNTMPTLKSLIVDEENVDDAFENIFNMSTK